MDAEPSLVHAERPARGKARGALVFFHGVYGSREDFVPFMDKIDPERRFHAFLPQGPYPMAEGRSAWGDPETQGPVDLPPVLAWLTALPFPRTHLVLGGWSQGAAVAYGAGLSPGEPPAALIALGGRIPDEVSLDLAHPPRRVFIAHGENDDSVPVEEARRARVRLSDAGAHVTYRETAVGHTIDQAIIPTVRAFLAGATSVGRRRASGRPTAGRESRVSVLECPVVTKDA